MLNILQEEQIRLLRSQGVGYRQIANRLNLSRDAVRYYCKANDLNGHREAVLSNTQCIKTTALALQIIMKKSYFLTPVLCKSSRKTDFLPRGKIYRIFHGGGVKRLT